VYKDERRLSGTYLFLDGAFPEIQIPKYTVKLPLVVFTGIFVFLGSDRIRTISKRYSKVLPTQPRICGWID